ncbi:hypothetical protein BDAP_000177 [Binucleata daphniae]
MTHFIERKFNTNNHSSQFFLCLQTKNPKIWMIFNKILIERKTQEIISDPSNVDSSVFVDIYNEIYKSCTMSNKKHEILGRDIYNLLTDILNKYTQEIKTFNSINEAVVIFDNYKKTIKILQMSYKYLERYFIKVSIEKKDGYVMDIQTLSLTFFYRNYLERNIKKVIELFRLELYNIKSLRDGRIVVLRKFMQMYREILDRNDESRKHKLILECFVSHYLQKMNLNENLVVLSKKIIDVMKVARSIFEPFFIHKIERKFLAKIAHRKKEFVVLLIESFDLKKTNSFYYNSLLLLDYLEKLYENFEVRIPEKIRKECNDDLENEEILKRLYKNYNKYIKIVKRYCNEDARMLNIIDCSYKNVSFSTFEDTIIKVTNDYVLAQDSIKLSKLTNFINTINLSTTFNEKLLHATQNRLIFKKSDYKVEEEFIKLLDDEKFHIYLSKAERCLSDIKKNSKNFLFANNNGTYNLVEKDIEIVNENKLAIEIDLTFVNSCFYNLRHDDIPDCNSTLHKIVDLLLYDLKKKHKTKIIHINYKMSPVIIEVNGYEIKLSVNMYLILDELEKHKNITEANLIRLLNLEDSKDIENLCKLNVIKKHIDILSINYDIQDNINAFDEIYDRQITEKTYLQPQISDTINFESKIMQILKKTKKMSKTELMKEFEEKHANKIIESLNKLVDKDFIEVDNDLVKYLP